MILISQFCYLLWVLDIYHWDVIEYWWDYCGILWHCETWQVAVECVKSTQLQMRGMLEHIMFLSYCMLGYKMADLKVSFASIWNCTCRSIWSWMELLVTYIIRGVKFSSTAYNCDWETFCQIQWNCLKINYDIQSTLDISKSDISNSANLETSIWIKYTFWLLSPSIIWRWRLFYKSKLPEVQINLHFM